MPSLRDGPTPVRCLRRGVQESRIFNQVFSVNIDELDDPELYNIQLIPMFVVWFQGRELKRTSSSVMEDVRKLVQESYDIACRGD